MRNYKSLRGRYRQYTLQHKLQQDPEPPTVMEVKTIINIWLLIKLKSFCTTMKREMKTYPSEWEKITANEATDKGLISKIYKQLIQLRK